MTQPTRKKGNPNQGNLLAAFGSKCNFALVDCHQALIGNGYAVRVLSEVLDDLLEATEWPLAVDIPTRDRAFARTLACAWGPRPHALGANSCSALPLASQHRGGADT